MSNLEGKVENDRNSCNWIVHQNQYEGKKVNNEKINEGKDNEISIHLLRIYYQRLFPHSHFYRWLSYGNRLTFSKREISFILTGDIYIRCQSFDTQDDFTKRLYRECPITINLGAVFQKNPKDTDSVSQMIPKEKEIIFDIDMSDYDDVRTCCSGANVCTKCWKFMIIACHILDTALQDDFGYQHRLWVFSGRRGIHCWVCDEAARQISADARSALADYLCIVIGGANTEKKVHFQGDRIPSSVKRALKIIDNYFPSIVEEQDILGSKERFDNFLQLIDKDLRHSFQTAMECVNTSLEKWTVFEKTFDEMLKNDTIPKHLRNLKDELKLQYAYLRLDISVTKGLNHLLKAPFSIHQKTGKIAVPFDPKNVESFNPNTVPTVEGLIKEIENYHKEMESTENSLKEIVDGMKIGDNKITRPVEAITVVEKYPEKMEDTDKSSTEINTGGKIEDYKKTSLVEAINVFEKFLEGIEN